MIRETKAEFGDFQTPLDLAYEVARFLAAGGECYDAIVEPTCGRGSFVKAAMAAFPKAKSVFGFDINPLYVNDARTSAGLEMNRTPIFERRDFFAADWSRFFASIEGRLLVVGNPPWVTNSALGAMGSGNLPEKSNFQRLEGFAAKTGKANFDISEWMLIKLLEAMRRRAGCLAMLCKTAIARKVLRHAWLNGMNIGRCSLHLFDAQKHFCAAVDACLLVVHTGGAESTAIAPIYRGISFDSKIATMGLVGKELVADAEEYHQVRDIDGLSYYTWRSGVKHDAAAVMEFRRENGHFTNGRGEARRLEETHLYPLLKSSDVANGRMEPARYVLLTQRKPSDDTAALKSAPKTWAYLTENAAALDARRSVIYKKRARFSIFGVGDYTFSPWKVAISGLYKNCHFRAVGRHEGKPIVLDDTCYFIPCATEAEAVFIRELLNSDICQKFIHSLVFLDAKRPVTIDLLNRIDLKRVADRVGRSAEAKKFLPEAAAFEDRHPLLVFEKQGNYEASMPRKRR